MENETKLPIDLLTTDEAAAYLKLSPRTLESWREAGNGPPFVKLGRAVRYSRAAIDRLLSEMNFNSTAEASKTSRELRGQKMTGSQADVAEQPLREKPDRSCSLGVHRLSPRESAARPAVVRRIRGVR